jgi:transposase-like protein
MPAMLSDWEVSMARQVKTDDSDRRAQWRARLQRFAGSGQTVAAFCAAEGISAWSLYDWRRRLGEPGRRSRRAAARRFIAAGTLPLAPQAGVTRAAPDGGATAGIELQLELGAGVVLRIRRL